jgi:hypothetical protein
MSRTALNPHARLSSLGKFMTCNYLKIGSEIGRPYGPHLLDCLAQAAREYNFSLVYGGKNDLAPFLSRLVILTQDTPRVMLRAHGLEIDPLLVEKELRLEHFNIEGTRLLVRKIYAFWHQKESPDFISCGGLLPMGEVAPPNNSFFIFRCIVRHVNRIEPNDYLHLKMYCLIRQRK